MGRRRKLPQVLATAHVLRAELAVLRARGISASQEAAAAAVVGELDLAEEAARGEVHANPFSNWWRGTQVETASQHMHAARALMIDVYPVSELAAEVPRAVARAQVALNRDDPRCLSARAFDGKDEPSTRAILRRLVEDGFQASDQQYMRLRSFRNIIYLSALAVTILGAVTLLVVASKPDLLPLCFGPGTDTVGSDGAGTWSCPSGNKVDGPVSSDILIVSLMGFLGGALSAVFSIRSLRGTSTPYDAPVALAILKLPLGALTAVLGLALVKGEFVPGLSNLDSQGQILAYALLFGIAQQLVTGLVDQRAQSILEGLPSMDPQASSTQLMRTQAVTAAADDLRDHIDSVAAEVPPGDVGDGEPGEFDETDLEAVLPNPEGDEGEQVQDDGSEPMADAATRDHS